MGFHTHTVYKNSWTPEQIRDSVRYKYNENGVNLKYLLIVGDHEDVPGQNIPRYYIYHTFNNNTQNIDSISCSPHVSDYYYSCVDNELDSFRDISTGRISVNSLTNAYEVFNKIYEYEFAPCMVESFYRKGVNCAFFEDSNHDSIEDRFFTYTSEIIRDYMINNHQKDITRVYSADITTNPLYWSYNSGNVPDDLKKPNFEWDGDSEEILSSINNGCYYVLHRDHGSTSSWASPKFQISHIRQLNNGSQYPVVFSMNCLTGKYNNRTCFSEEFLRKPNSGCVGIYAASEISYSPLNDYLAVGMFDAMYPEPGLQNRFIGQNNLNKPILRLGEILDQGLVNLTNGYTSYPNIVRYTKEIFHLFGDPSMRIFTNKPLEFTGYSIDWTSDNISVSIDNEQPSLNEEGGEIISFYNLLTQEISNFPLQNMIYHTGHPNNVIISLTGKNRVTEVLYPPCYQEDILYLQNCNLNGSLNIIANKIICGSNVTNSQFQGASIFSSGEIKIRGNEIILESGTEIKNGVNVSFTNY